MPTAPVLDDDVLHRLGEQLGSSDALCGFLRRYLALLEQRIARLERALDCADQDDWKDAVLSLKTSSVMAGAQALAEQAADLEQESAGCPSWLAPAGAVEGQALAPAPGKRDPALTRRAERMACLRRLAAETARQLRAFLRRVGGAPGTAIAAPCTATDAPPARRPAPPS
ncbi:hypothetical protein CFK39_06350 [Brachybacterium avium]|uniref:HPt domain-containing protein n=1 Tax=Brachybacterium avium TaxID=2017485 RepID=A0A220UBS3_9MICO|nr:Hpt domain-containing protein [Brachybacterium avium]ASK65515.1 hypothetical protein CFK39_06350 [Brachybacterium avium]